MSRFVLDCLLFLCSLISFFKVGSIVNTLPKDEVGVFSWEHRQLKKKVALLCGHCQEISSKPLKIVILYIPVCGVASFCYPAKIRETVQQ